MMTAKDLIAMTAVKADEGWQHESLVVNARCVLRHGYPLAYFKNEKDASAYVYHLTGRSPFLSEGQGINIRHVGTNVMPGGKVIYDGNGSFDCMRLVLGENGNETQIKSGFGIVGGSFMEDRDDVSITFNCTNPYYDEDGCNGGGGPVPYGIKKHNLKIIDIAAVAFWRWSDGLPRANSGGYFTITVPVYRWNGQRN